MKREILFSMPSTYREPMDIVGFRFGEGEKSIVIVGSTRGNEVQQMFVCSRLVNILKQIEAGGKIKPGKEILVIPCLNSASMNIKKHFWPGDNTDINRTFPGYALGETTQRIADGVFQHLQDYAYGVQLASFYQHGLFLPHVKLMQCHYTDPELMKDFGLRYGIIRTPRPYDTTTLNYNWQIWNTQAFSLYSSGTNVLNLASADECVAAILRFMAQRDIIERGTDEGYVTEIIEEDKMYQVSAESAGILVPKVRLGQHIHEGDLLCEIMDPLDGSRRDTVISKVDGTVFFIHDDPLLTEHAVMLKIILTEESYL